MRQFSIAVRSFSDIQAFVALSTQQPFDVLVGNCDQHISGTSLMSMLGLNYRRPILVSVNCDEAAFQKFQQAASRFLIA